jgi:IS5 family transposase
VLTLWAGQAESLWDDALPIEVKELPEDLAALDVVLADPELMMVLLERWRREGLETGRLVLTDGRPTIAMETYVRLMVLKTRFRWGYRSLVAEVSDSIHLRRFCRISLSERVPDESTVRKLTRRVGAETVSELTRTLIETATREKRFRPRAVRIDSTVVEADVRYPTDAGLASHGVQSLAREGRKLAKLIGEKRARVRDRSKTMGRHLRELTRTIRRRTGEAKAEVLALTEQTGELLGRSIKEARKLAAAARRSARGRGARAKLNAAKRLEELADRCEKVAGQIKLRVAGKPIKDRIVSLADPDARPIRKGQARQAERVRVRRADRGGDRAHPARRQRADPSRPVPDRQSGREHAPARNRRRAREAQDLTPGGRARRRISDRTDQHSVRQHTAPPGVHRRPPATRVCTHTTPVASLPNRCRGTDQPPQTPLRPGPQPAQGPPRPADLD